MFTWESVRSGQIGARRCYFEELKKRKTAPVNILDVHQDCREERQAPKKELKRLQMDDRGGGRLWRVAVKRTGGSPVVGEVRVSREVDGSVVMKQI
ncbi:hypothetical protein NC653_006634 [Populus alba x Populus x berolinensis]|uniref:Uncharacterized protein n=1 Tax=Populus alba x Populus x berolinensis TaxID=444605 RepID=A0AAD6RFE5_9ROSI|nr:hypothetical protein NC653_006634 [Populus alba x Populus x berolinensis]